jgi:hypothetical protein
MTFQLTSLKITRLETEEYFGFKPLISNMASRSDERWMRTFRLLEPDVLNIHQNSF